MRNSSKCPVEHCLEREIAQMVHRERSIRRPIASWVNALTTELHVAADKVTNQGRTRQFDRHSTAWWVVLRLLLESVVHQSPKRVQYVGDEDKLAGVKWDH